MFITKHLEGRIQCVDGDFVCINLHFKSQVDVTRPFITQIFLNRIKQTWTEPCFSSSKGDYYFDNASLHDEMQDIVNQYYLICKQLNL